MNGAPCIWLDAFALAALPRVDEELGRAGALVMRSFQRVPQPDIAARFGGRDQAVVISGRTLDELERRLEVASVALRVPIVAVTPAGVAPSQVGRRAGLVDVLQRGSDAKEAAARIVLMSRVPVVTRTGAQKAPVARPVVLVEERARRGAALPVVAVASSTGGLLVLAEILRRLSPQSVSGILVAQHMEAEFVPLFASWLSEASGWPVEIVSQPSPVAPGRVLMPDGGCDLFVDDRARAVCAPAAARYVPSADRLLSSVARVFGRDAVGVVLSGMGEDGARGAAEVIRCGGRVLAQSPATAAVASMPKAAARVDGVQVVAPEALAAAIAESGAAHDVKGANQT